MGKAKCVFSVKKIRQELSKPYIPLGNDGTGLQVIA